MFFDPDKPYNDLLLLPPKAELEIKAVLRKAIAANKALAESKGAGDLIPKQSALIHMFAKRTCCENVSRKTSFWDISQKHVQYVVIFNAALGIFFGVILISRQKRTSKWRDSTIAPHRVAG